MTSSKRKANLQHYLISYPLPGGYVHGYVMTDDAAVLPACIDRMIGEAGKMGMRSPLPMVLQTHLDDGWEIVRQIISAHDSSKPAWDKAKDFHFTAWIMPESDPDTKRLMELH
jgi:hypothetical protein